MNPLEAQLAGTHINNALLVALIKKIDRMEKKVDAGSRKVVSKLNEKNPVLRVDEALRLFRDHLVNGVSRRGQHFKKPENYEVVLRAFEGVFEGKRNMADVTPEEIDHFLRGLWHTPSTLKQRSRELSAFFSWCIRLLQRRRKPTFVNPVSLLDPIHATVKTAELIETDTIRNLLKSATNERQWLMFAILATAGLRVSEMLGLRKSEVNGRVLTLHGMDGGGLKSGNAEEIAVIPQYVARRLERYAKAFEPEDRLFDIQRVAVFKALKVRRQNPHALRKWCITYWNRKGREDMVQFVSRHSKTTLRDRYVAPLTPQEAVRKQDIMEKELFCG
jgi:integrase